MNIRFKMECDRQHKKWLSKKVREGIDKLIDPQLKDYDSWVRNQHGIYVYLHTYRGWHERYPGVVYYFPFYIMDKRVIPET